MSAQYHVIASGGIQCNAVVVWDDTTREAVLIDPTDDGQAVLDWVEQKQLRVGCVLLTHGHFDHSADAERVAQVLGKHLYLHPLDLKLYRACADQAHRFGFSVQAPTRDPEPIQDGDEIPLSAQLRLQVLHVPGHSQGGVAFYLPEGPWLFVGDTLFAGSVGRTDLPGGSSRDLKQSVLNKLYRLPDDCVVIPGHGPTTTIGREKRHNAFIRAE